MRRRPHGQGARPAAGGARGRPAAGAPRRPLRLRVRTGRAGRSRPDAPGRDRLPQRARRLAAAPRDGRGRRARGRAGGRGGRERRAADGRTLGVVRPRRRRGRRRQPGPPHVRGRDAARAPDHGGRLVRDRRVRDDGPLPARPRRLPLALPAPRPRRGRHLRAARRAADARAARPPAPRGRALVPGARGRGGRDLRAHDPVALDRCRVAARDRGRALGARRRRRRARRSRDRRGHLLRAALGAGARGHAGVGRAASAIPSACSRTAGTSC